MFIHFYTKQTYKIENINNHFVKKSTVGMSQKDFFDPLKSVFCLLSNEL